MGDGGSNFIGFILASISLISTQKSNKHSKSSYTNSLFFIPVFDMALVIILRMKARESLSS